MEVSFDAVRNGGLGVLWRRSVQMNGLFLRILSKHRRLVVGLLTATLSLSLALEAPAADLSANGGASPELWFGAVADEPTAAGWSVDPDYPQLFEPDSSWQRARSRLFAFEMVRHYVTVVATPEDKLRTMYAFLNEHHIALAVATGVVPSQNGCGVEGTARGAENVQMAKRLKKLGADLKYIVLDEPYTFGHAFQGRNGCRYDTDALAHGVAGEIQKIRDFYPDAQIVDVEATEGIDSPAEFGRWLDALKREMGDGAPKVVRFDVQWASTKKPWRQTAPALVATVRQHGLDYGLVVDGTPLDQTDEAWIKTAEANLKAWEQTVQAPPEQVVIQSWHRHPTMLLPETSPATLPYLVDWYCDNAAMAHGCK
jgi:hypothetical protein